MKYTLDELLLKRLTGWSAEEWIFLPTLHDLKFLSNYSQLEKREDYTGVFDMSVMVICGKQNVTDGWREVEKLIKADVCNLALWIIGVDHIKEIVFSHHRPSHAGTVLLNSEWTSVVKQFAEAA